MHNYFQRSLSAAWYLLGQLFGYRAASLWEIDHRWSRRSQSAPILQIQKLTRQSKWLGQSRKSSCITWRRRRRRRRSISFIIVHCCSPKPRLGTLQMHSRLPAYPRMMVRGLEAAAWGTNNRPGNQQPLCAGELQNKIRNISSSSGRSERRRAY